MSLLVIVKWIHVLAAIAAVGANLTYGLWISRAAREPQTLPFVLRSIHVIDSRLANPCYGLLLVTGLVMAYLLPIPLTTPWLLTAIVLYVLAAFLGVFAYAPTLPRADAAPGDRADLEDAGYQAAARQGTLMGILVTAGCGPDRLSDGRQAGLVGLAPGNQKDAASGVQLSCMGAKPRRKNLLCRRFGAGGRLVLDPSGCCDELSKQGTRLAGGSGYSFSPLALFQARFIFRASSSMMGLSHRMRPPEP